MGDNKTYVVVLNWRGWRDTLTCLHSVFQSSGCGFRVIVCDNDSGDGSAEHIVAWSRGELDAGLPSHPRLAGLAGADVPRPACDRIDRATAESGSYRCTTPLVLIDNGANLGFAAGNNVGLRLALSQPDMGSVWLLNNDTVVEPQCLARMRAALRDADDRAVVGSVIHFFDNPEIIQAVGGNRFNHYTGIAARSEGRYLEEGQLHCTGQAARRIDYVSGCSMLLPRSFLEEVGLMSEDYFLYYEEIDWFMRAGRRYPIRIPPAARLYHREGSAIGSRSWRRGSSTLSEYHMLRSRLIFMRKFYRRWLPLCYLAGLLDAAKHAARGQFANAATVLKVLAGGRSTRVPA
jgi:GT2 family glycosyltransferase